MYSQVEIIDIAVKFSLPIDQQVRYSTIEFLSCVQYYLLNDTHETYTDLVNNDLVELCVNMNFDLLFNNTLRYMIKNEDFYKFFIDKVKELPEYKAKNRDVKIIDLLNGKQL